MKQILTTNLYPDWPNTHVNFEKPIKIYFDLNVGYEPNKKVFNIFYLNETVQIEKTKKWLIENFNLFDAIITHHPDVLCQCPNSYLFVRGTTWIKDFNIKQKHFSISNLAGDKNITFGHKLRNKIHYYQNEIKTPKRFFVGNRPGCPEPFEGNFIIKDSDVNPIYESMFNFAITNIQSDNWIQETLINCFITKTVPIYYGAKNVGDFFDKKGILEINNVKEAIAISNQLTEQTYKEMLPAIENNYNKSLEYLDLTGRFTKLVQEILEKQ